MKPRLPILIAATVLVAAFAFLLRDFVRDEVGARFERSERGEREDRQPSKPRRPLPSVEPRDDVGSEQGEGPTEEAAETSGRRDVLRVGCRNSGGQPWTLHYLAFEDIDLATKTELLVVATDITRLLLERGTKLELEAGALAELPLATAGYHLIATAEGRQSPPLEADNLRESYEPGHRLSLRLERVRKVEILVLDAGGNPAQGVPLVERSRAPSTGGEDRAKRGVLGFALSGAEGIARFTVPVGRVEGHVIELGTPCNEPPFVEMPEPGERGSLQLPPCGSIEVTFFADRAGQQLLRDPLGVTLYPTVKLGHDGLPFQWSKRAEGGLLRFDWISLDDLPLGVGARPLDESREPRDQRFIGPGSRGDLIRVQLVLHRRRASIRGLLVDETGQVLAGAGLVVRREEEPRGSGESLHASDDSGHFGQGLQYLDAGMPYDGLVFTVTHARGLRYGIDAPRGSYPMQSGLAFGMNDLGTIVCEQPPELFGGRILTTEGNVAVGVEVEFVPFVADVDLADHELRSLRAVTDAEGRFSFRGDPVLKYRLRLPGRKDFLTELLGPEPSFLDIRLP